MTKKNKKKQVNKEVEEILSQFMSKDLDEDVAIAVAGTLFVNLGQRLNLSQDQFLFLCDGLAEKATWNNKEVDDARSTA